MRRLGKHQWMEDETMSEKKRSKKDKNYKRVSVGGWMGTLLLSSIPVINLILWLIWAFSAKRPSRKTYAIACLILTLIFAAAIAAVISFFGKEILEWARQIDPQLFTKALGLVE